MLKRVIIYLFCHAACLVATGQARVNSTYISSFRLPYVATLSVERTGAGLEISPDNTLVPPTASFPFNTGTNVAMYVSYKFINFSLSQSIHRQTNNRSFVAALNLFGGENNFGGKIGFYQNVAAVQDKKNLEVKTAINLFKFSPYWLYNSNYKRFSLQAVSDYSKRQKRSAGALMFEMNPFFIRARGKNGEIIPDNNIYKPLFKELAGLQNLSIVNLDLRLGYMYTKSFNEGEYFISGGLFLGPGFGYHHTKTVSVVKSGMHWQSSVRMQGAGGYNGDRFFVVGSFRYTNSFTPVSSAGVLSDEGSLMLTLGLRFKSFENKIPSSLDKLIR
jgi:hypothetical protein